MWRLKNEWNKLRKREQVGLITLLVIILICFIYSFVVARLPQQPTAPQLEHMLAECQHEEYVDICIALKQIYGEDANVKYSLYQTLNCTEPLVLTINKTETTVYIKPLVNNTGRIIQAILSISSITITFVIFLIAFIYITAFKKKSYVVDAIITNIIEEEYYNKQYHEYRMRNIYVYEYRDWEYHVQRGRTMSFKHHNIGDKLEIIYLKNKSSKSINKQIFQFIQFIPWVFLFVFLMTVYIWYPTIINLVT